jgi:hypothetical protein
MFRQAGVEVDLARTLSIRMDVSEAALLGAIAALEDESKRRSDRKNGLIGRYMHPPVDEA